MGEMERDEESDSPDIQPRARKKQMISSLLQITLQILQKDLSMKLVNGHNLQNGNTEKVLNCWKISIYFILHLKLCFQ